MESSTMLMQNISSESMSDSEDGDSLSYHPEQKLDGSNSPTDVRSYRHTRNHNGDGDGDGEYNGNDDGLDLNRSLARLGDLPIVREGSILNGDEDNDILMHGSHTDDHYDTYIHNDNRGDDDRDDDDDDDDDEDEEINNQFMEYEREQEELHREMNLNKIAFAAYRSAVLHLVHNQASFTKKHQENDDTDDNDDDDTDDNDHNHENHDDGSVNASKSQDDDIRTVDTQEDANLRMTVIEETAKEIVETKAKACFDAVVVAHEFGKLREEKRLRQRMLLGGLAGVGGEDNILEEFRKMRKFGKGVRAKRAEKATVNVNVDVDVDVPKESSPPPIAKPTVSKPKVAVVTKKSIKPKPIKKKNTTSSSSNTEFKLSLAGPILPPIVGPIVRMKKKPSRHVDCIKHTLPKFQPRKTTNNNTKENNNGRPAAHTNDNNDTSSSSCSTSGYRTTKWIREISKWRTEKNDHEEARLTKCGCPDCLVELKCMYDKKKVFSVTQ